MKRFQKNEISLSQKFLLLIGSLETEFQFSDLDGLHRIILFQILNAYYAGNNITINNILALNLSSRSSVYRKISDLKRSDFLAEEWDGYICHLVPTPKISHVLTRIDQWLGENNVEGQGNI